jgi:lipopolysaccharide biosynthesis protein
MRSPLSGTCVADERDVTPRSDVSPRVLGFYLPQFHPIPENDRWWGRGFTEWTNVTRARPLFRGHYQPHLPADLGFYDLRLPEVREAQAVLASEYGLDAFCYYHYWFNGKRLLSRPFDGVLESGRPDFPFCLCWANEHWTKKWDGRDDEILMRQEHSLKDDRAHIEHLLRTFEDTRYVKIDGRPLFLVYRTELLPDPLRTADLWRQTVQKAGFPDLYLVRVESFRSDVDPKAIGFDAALEFAPDKAVVRPTFKRSRSGLLPMVQAVLRQAGLISPRHHEHRIYSFDELVDGMLAKPGVPYKRFRCVTPGWDNSARRADGAIIFVDSTPRRYEGWLRAILQQTLVTHHGEERLIFINAWNEWAEGNHLEPDQLWGRAYLEATARALGLVPTGRKPSG